MAAASAGFAAGLREDIRDIKQGAMILGVLGLSFSTAGDTIMLPFDAFAHRGGETNTRTHLEGPALIGATERGPPARMEPNAAP